MFLKCICLSQGFDQNTYWHTFGFKTKILVLPAKRTQNISNGTRNNLQQSLNMESVCGKQKAVRAETPFLPDQNGRKQAKALPKSCVCLVNIQELDNKQAGFLGRRKKMYF